MLQQSIGDTSLVLYSKHVIGDGCTFFEQAQRQQLEGIIGKRRDSLYHERRTRDWVKIKAQLMQECVIGGFTEPRGSRKDLGALVLGVYEGKELVYIGHTVGGFNTQGLADVRAKLDPLVRSTCPTRRATVHAATWFACGRPTARRR